MIQDSLDGFKLFAAQIARHISQEFITIFPRFIRRGIAVKDCTRDLREVWFGVVIHCRLLLVSAGAAVMSAAARMIFIICMSPCGRLLQKQ
jgi:hypothetical protein